MSALSAGEQIVQAMVNALNAPSPKPCTTYRSRVDAFNQPELPAMVLYASKETAEVLSHRTAVSGGRMRRKRKVRLEAVVAGNPPADQALDPLYVFAVQTLQADAALQALVRQLYDSDLEWETEASTQDTALALVEFEAVYITPVDDPTVLITG